MDALSLVDDSAALDEYLAHEQLWSEPTIEPGQIWVVECEAGSLSAFHADLLTRANVVLYDGALVAAVAEALPIGVYAEKLSTLRSAGSEAAEWAIAPRALQFAADGWSVLQLVEGRAGRGRLLRSVTEDLKRPGDGNSPLLTIGTIRASRYRPDRYRQSCDTAADLAIVAAELRSDELLSLTFAPPGAQPGRRRLAQGQVFTANGLAG